MFVAHRLRTIFDSDKIIVLKDGVVAEEGEHSKLLGIEGGVYSNLWNGELRLARGLIMGDGMLTSV